MTTNVSMNTPNISAQSPELQKRLGDKENFTAIDKDKVKQDAVELSQKAGKQVKENFIFRTLRNVFGVKDPKKFVKSLGLTIASVIGVAVLGNKMSNKTADWGIKVDEVLKGDNILAKGYNSVGGALKKAGNGIKNFFFKSDTIKDVATVIKKENRMKPKCDMTRGYGRGFVSIFSLTPVDILGKVLNKTDDKGKIKLLQKLVGSEGDTADKLLKMFNAPNKDNREFCEALSKAMRKYLGNGKEVGNKEFLAALKDLQKGKFNGNDVSEFTHVAMKEGGLTGLVGSWWPVNNINRIGKAIGSEKMTNFCNGNLGDSLVKFNAVNGSLADTKLGQLAQKSITVPTESYSNFVNDKSGLGVFLCASIMSLWNNVQDAPKDKKVSTAADDVVGTIGSIALATPAAFATSYSLASLSKLVDPKEIKRLGLSEPGIKNKVLGNIGKFFSMGLGENSGKVARFGGGALRFALVMLVFSPMFQKPIKSAIHKIFGKPYDPAQAAREKQMEEQKNTVIPELGITQGQLLEKIQNNPEAVKKLQSDPELANKLAQNPKLLVDYLDGKDINAPQKSPAAPAQNAAKPQMSSANKAFLEQRKKALQQNNQTNQSAQGTQTPKTAQMPESATNKIEKAKTNNANKPSQLPANETGLVRDTATYIPSSAFLARPGSISSDKQQELNNALAKADKALARAEKFI